MIAIIFSFLFAVILAQVKYNFDVQYIRQSKMWVCFFNSGLTRKYFVIWKED